MQTTQNTDYSGNAELLLIEKYLKKYNKNLVSRLSKNFANGSVLDFGAGIATIAKLWKSRFGKAPDCLEIDQKFRKLLKEQKFNCFESFESLPQKYDHIYSANVLEHIQDDVTTLKKLNTALKTNGTIAIYVPALMMLYSHLDKDFGHYRRYEKKELIQKLQTANFKIIECHFVDSVGFFVAAIVKMFEKKHSRSFLGKKNLLFYDKFIYPLSILLDGLGAKYFFGKNLFILAKKL